MSMLLFLRLFVSSRYFVSVIASLIIIVIAVVMLVFVQDMRRFQDDLREISRAAAERALNGDRRNDDASAPPVPLAEATVNPMHQDGGGGQRGGTAYEPVDQEARFEVEGGGR